MNIKKIVNILFLNTVIFSQLWATTREELIEGVMKDNSFELSHRLKEANESLEGMKDDELLEFVNSLESELRKRRSKTSFLFQLLHHGHLAQSLRLIEAGVDSVLQANADGTTLMHVAATKRLVSVIQALIQKGANINAIRTIDKILGRANAPFYNITPLSDFISSQGFSLPTEDDISTLNCLLQHGADPNESYIERGPLLIYSVRRSRMDWITDKLLEYKANANQQSSDGRTPLLYAVAANDRGSAEKLLKSGASPNVRGLSGLSNLVSISPFHLAIIKGYTDMVLLLLSYGADLNLKTDHHFHKTDKEEDEEPRFERQEPFTPLALAIKYNQRDIADMLVQHARGHNIELDLARKDYRGFPDLRELEQGRVVKTLSTALRAFAARQKPVPEAPVPSYCLHGQDHAKIGLALDTVFKAGGLRNADGFFAPIRDKMLRVVEEEPQFGFYFLDGENVAGRAACYNPETRKEIIIDKKYNHLTMAAILAHEITHAVADRLYPHQDCAPNNDTRFMDALKTDLAHLESLGDEANFYIKELFSQVRGDHYPHHLHPSEYLARILQAAVTMAVIHPEFLSEDIDQIFQENIPQLWRFYQDIFLVACLEG